MTEFGEPNWRDHETLEEKRIEEIRERCKCATPGPWAHKEETPAGVHQPELECWIPQDKPDAYFIAHARSDIPWLLSHLEEVERGFNIMMADRHRIEEELYKLRGEK